MQLREYMISDCDQLTRLFFQTVHSVNEKDYTKEQLDVWYIYKGVYKFNIFFAINSWKVSLICDNM